MTMSATSRTSTARFAARPTRRARATMPTASSSGRSAPIPTAPDRSRTAPSATPSTPRVSRPRSNMARPTARATPIGRRSSPAQAVDVTYDTRRRVDARKLSSGGTDYALTQTDYYADDSVQCVAQRMNTAIYGSLPASACTLGTAGSVRPRPDRQDLYDHGRPGRPSSRSPSAPPTRRPSATLTYTQQRHARDPEGRREQPHHLRI